MTKLKIDSIGFGDWMVGMSKPLQKTSKEIGIGGWKNGNPH